MKFFAALILLFHSTILAKGVDTSATPSVKVKAIVVQGNEKTKDFVILREMSTKVGDTISDKSLEADQNRIYSLRLFNKVNIQSAIENDSATVYVIVHERWYWFPFPIIGFRNRDFSKLFYGAWIAHQNFRGRNEKVFFSFATGYDRWISLQYQNPKLTDDDDLFLRFAGSYGRIPNLSLLTGEYDQSYYTTNVTLGKRFGLYQTIFGTVGYDILQVSDPRVGRTLSTDGRDAYAYLSFRYTYDSRNIHEYATDGSYLSVGVNKSGFGESQVNLMTYDYDVRHFMPINDDLSFGARTFGTYAGGGIVPVYRHVYYGYGERLRGYFRDVWEAENIVGGNVEFRFAVLKPRYLTLSFIPVPEFSVLRYGLYVGFFADGGKVWYRDQSFPGSNWRSGYGAGLHFLLPYSLVIRTEYAFNNMGRGEFFIDMGASF
jgi:outer membrane protein assembly factor BamA